MVDDLKYTDREEHASNLGAIIARGIADREGIPSFIVDPVAVDEFQDVARVSGLPELPRRSMVHALNVKAISRRAAKNIGKNLSDTRFIVCHLGGGITIASVVGGRIIDANVAVDGGPFSPDRAGTVPSGDLVRLCFSGKYTLNEIKKKVIGHGGFIGYLGISDGREVEKRIAEGDEKAERVYDAMCYQISKEIWSAAAVLSGNVDAVVLTGGLAYSERLVGYIRPRVAAIAPLMHLPGEDEMLALAQGANRVLKGEETAKIYEDEVFGR
jgi:butyrate kinase